MPEKTVISLFSGCGGFDLGFSRQGFRVLAAYDSDPLAVEVHNRNAGGVARRQDLAHDCDFPTSDVIVATPPCQGFSTIGKLHPKDDRNNLLVRACQIAVAQLPEIFILENVVGLAYRAHQHLLGLAVSVLNNAGYHVEVYKVACEDLGLPQRRKRLFLVARRGARPFALIFPHRPRSTVADAFAKLYGTSVEEALPELPKGTKDRLIAERIRPGQKLSNVRRSDAAVHTWDIPEVFGAVSEEERQFLVNILRLRRTERVRKNGDADPVTIERLEAAYGAHAEKLVDSLISKSYLRKIGEKVDLRHTFNGTYRRLQSDDVSPTVDTHFGNARLFLHPSQHRGLSYHEAAVLQGFSPTHNWPSARSTCYRLIGNAVPPPIGEIVAAMTRSLL
jgi:DNA (cytosine-5)-methyltransferase 1